MGDYSMYYWSKYSHVYGLAYSTIIYYKSDVYKIYVFLKDNFVIFDEKLNIERRMHGNCVNIFGEGNVCQFYCSLVLYLFIFRIKRFGLNQWSRYDNLRDG